MQPAPPLLLAPLVLRLMHRDEETLLIVEDDPTFAATLQRALRRRGIEAHVAAAAAVPGLCH